MENKLNPHDWFCSEYGIDILEERLSVIEHSGLYVIKFIERYLNYLKEE